MVERDVGSNYRNLRVWHTAMALVVEVYRISQSFPHAEQFGLTSQLRRAAVAVPSNIAEGQCKSPRSFLHHISHSRGSLQELITLTVITERRHYGVAGELAEIVKRADREGALLFGLSRSVRV